MFLIFHIQRIFDIVDNVFFWVEKFNFKCIISAEFFEMVKAPHINLLVHVLGEVIPGSQRHKLSFLFESWVAFEARLWQKVESRSRNDSRHGVVFVNPNALILSRLPSHSDQRHVIHWQITHLSFLIDWNFSKWLRIDYNWLNLETNYGQAEANEDWNGDFEAAQTGRTFP